MSSKVKIIITQSWEETTIRIDEDCATISNSSWVLKVMRIELEKYVKRSCRVFSSLSSVIYTTQIELRDQKLQYFTDQVDKGLLIASLIALTETSYHSVQL